MSTNPPPITTALVRRLAACETACRLERLESLRQALGPDGIGAERRGEAVALRCEPMAENTNLNCVLGYTAEAATELDGLLAGYQPAGIRPAVDLLPGGDTAAATAPLVARGFQPVSWTSLLYRAPAPLAGDLPAGVSIEPVTPANQVDFGRIFLVGFAVDAQPAAETCRQVGGWCGLPAWRGYLARVDGEAAAVAALTVRDGLGYLALAATLPEFRGRGCQTALLRQRVNDATVAGCELVCGMAAFDSTSQHNFERCGFRLAAVAQAWRPPAAS